MTPNPGQPLGTPAPSGAAQEMLNVPSILIIVLGGLGLALSLLGLVSALGGGDQAMAGAMLKFLPPEQQDQFRQAMASAASGGRAGGIVQNLLLTACAALTVYGGLQMRALKSWGLALAAAILAMLPCGSNCCCCIGLPVGIWVIITLTKPEVKSAFS